MARLPQPGSDQGTWGTVLNEFLQVSHNDNGTLKTNWYNVKDYGAKGDNVTDDSAAFQAAITASGWPSQLSNRGGSVGIYIPPGIYRINNSILIDGKGQTSTPELAISGYGARLYTEIPNLVVFDVTNSVTSLTRVSFIGIFFFINSGSGNVGVRMKNSELCEFISCKFLGAFSTGVEFIGIGSYNGTNHHNRFLSCDFGNLARGISVNSDANYLEIANCSFNEQLVGNPKNWIELTGTVKMVTISNCSFYGTGATLPIIRTANAIQTNIIGCNFMECDATAIELGNSGSAAENSVIGCQFQYVAGHGIHIKGSYNIISNNHFRTISYSSNNNPGAKTRDAIFIQGGYANIVTGNTASDATNTRYLVNESSSSKTLVANNIAKSGIGINLTGSGSINQNNITA